MQWDILVYTQPRRSPCLSREPTKEIRAKSLKTNRLFLGTLAVRLGRVVAPVHNEVLGPVVIAARPVRVQDGLCAGGVALRVALVSHVHNHSNSKLRHTFCASIEVPDMWGTMALPPPQGLVA
jgi:hypothetical protein